MGFRIWGASKRRDDVAHGVNRGNEKREKGEMGKRVNGEAIAHFPIADAMGYKMSPLVRLKGWVL